MSIGIQKNRAFFKRSDDFLNALMKTLKSIFKDDIIANHQLIL